MAKSKEVLTYDLKSLETAISILEENKKRIGLTLLDKAVFLDSKLKELQDDINTNGLNVDMPQGNYSIVRANPSCSTYNNFIKQYQSLIKQISELLPNEEKQQEINEFDL